MARVYTQIQTQADSTKACLTLNPEGSWKIGPDFVRLIKDDIYQYIADQVGNLKAEELSIVAMSDKDTEVTDWEELIISTAYNLRMDYRIAPELSTNNDIVLRCDNMGTDPSGQNSEDNFLLPRLSDGSSSGHGSDELEQGQAAVSDVHAKCLSDGDSAGSSSEEDDYNLLVDDLHHSSVDVTLSNGYSIVSGIKKDVFDRIRHTLMISEGYQRDDIVHDMAQYYCPDVPGFMLSTVHDIAVDIYAEFRAICSRAIAAYEESEAVFTTG